MELGLGGGNQWEKEEGTMTNREVDKKVMQWCLDFHGCLWGMNRGQGQQRGVSVDQQCSLQWVNLDRAVYRWQKS